MHESRSKEEMRELRIKANTPNFKKAVLKVHGRLCVNCGSDVDIDLHHIVPLSSIGTNSIYNVVPLCHKCHMAVHGHCSETKESIKRSATGRPKKIAKVEDWESIIDDYLHCRIGQRETKERLQMGASSKLADAIWFKEYRMRNGITEYRNNVDLRLAKRNDGLSFGWPLGYLVQHGVRKEFYYEPQGWSSV